MYKYNDLDEYDIAYGGAYVNARSSIEKQMSKDVLKKKAPKAFLGLIYTFFITIGVLGLITFLFPVLTSMLSTFTVPFGWDSRVDWGFWPFFILFPFLIFSILDKNEGALKKNSEKIVLYFYNKIYGLSKKENILDKEYFLELMSEFNVEAARSWELFLKNRRLECVFKKSNQYGWELYVVLTYTKYPMIIAEGKKVE